MPGFAAAKPGTGQTVRAIIAPASCRHDNCNAHCLIIVRLSDFPLYSAALRPLPAGNPAGPALHNKTLCKLARGNDEPHAAKAATALKGTRPASCRGVRVPAASPPPHLSPPGKPFGLPQVAAMPICPGRASTVCHLLSSFHLFCAARLRVAASSGHCGRVPNGLNQLAGNQQQAQSLPPAPRGLQFMKESCQRQKVSSNFL